MSVLAVRALLADLHPPLILDEPNHLPDLHLPRMLGGPDTETPQDCQSDLGFAAKAEAQGLTMDGSAAEVTKRQAIAEGMRCALEREDGSFRALEGLTSVEEVPRVVA